MRALEVLKKYWGYDNFRAQQDEIVESAIKGFDTFALLPTGGGKSICFQVPALVREGICIVVSPLIALMQDQVKNLQSRGIKAAAITSGMSRREIDITLDNAKFNDLKFLYVSPERLKTEIFITRFRQMKVGLIAVDEAHCISQWGHDFRPPYLEIHQLRNYHPDVPIIAVTATATERVKADIIQHLSLKEPNYFEGNFARPNISYELYEVENKRNAILKACRRFPGATGIIYCQTRKDTKEIARLLLSHNLSVGVYHGGMDGEERKKKLDAWMKDDIRIMIATNAFGMGIDKPDVRFVLHYEIPNNIEAYFQEAGRSGRDGKESRNLAFYNQVDLERMRQKLRLEFPEIDFIKTVYRALCNHLNIAIGSGENESYELNILEMAEKYNLDVLSTYNSLKLLELNNTLLFNEATFNPTKLKFVVGNKSLYDFQIRNEKYDPLISVLSRSYTGIFSDFKEINERKIAQLLKTSSRTINEQLSYLEKQGLIDISWQNKLPMVTFLHERLPDDYMRIDSNIYHRRKEVAEIKLEAMINFVASPICRSILLLTYFGQTGEKCGKCDVCIAESKSNYTAKEIQDIVLELVKEKDYTLDELILQVSDAEKHLMTKTVSWMIDEDLIKLKEGKRLGAKK